ncbi:DNA-binding response regulator [Jannaschia pagri]|uniref:DNA-binding response regulator n=1 Tax=Jannaschia pagri TaxID=2829797 RepID=A0ABQ4NQH7_9RHOB|nr:MULTISPECIES: response regulator transcription factor [unclassified Jannaschia]GIT92834.1 DNA-binding response regulator [Jannaschia sp. AI_61]GIT96669.1 DNA-binding response regulator [Jannaschia sp. AI_62]
MSATIAILDDDPAIRSILTDALTDAGMQVTAHARADAFEAQVRRAMPDLCLVDLGLPDRDGLAVVSRLALEGGAAIIIISGRGQVQDRITGLELGADDYVVKPFEPAEIVARVRARLRKAAPPSQSRATFGEWSVDFDRYVLSGPPGDVSFSQAEGEVLRLFLDRPRRLISRADMQEALGGAASEAFDRAIDVRISRLRAKLGEDPKNPALIKTIYGAGYLFLGDVHWQG